MNNIKRFEELSDAFISIYNSRYFRIYYSIKILQLEDCNIFCNINESIIKSPNYIRIGKHRRVNGISFGGINYNYTIQRETVINTFDYINLINTFKKDNKFLNKIINILEKELLK